MRHITKLVITADDGEELTFTGYGFFGEVRTTQRDEDHKETPVYYVTAQLTPEKK